MQIKSTLFYLACLHFILGQTFDSSKDKQDDFIKTLCSEKKSMLKRGLSEEMATRIIGKKIEKLSRSMLRGSYPYYIQPVGVKRRTEVGPHGQSLNSAIVGIQESTITNVKQLTVDQSHNDFKKSDTSEFLLTSRPTFTPGKTMMDSPKLPINNPVKLECSEQDRDEIQRRLKNMGHDGKIDSSRGNNLLRQSSTNGDNLANTLVDEKTGIGAGGNSIDFVQIGSGTSQNTVEYPVKDEQEHSTYEHTKAVSTILSLSTTTSLG